MTHLKTALGMPVSTLTFGTMQFGGTADFATSQAMYDVARTAGICHFDTAVLYTGGASETYLGQFILAERDAIYLATKVGYKGGAARANITAQFDQSRKNLNQDSVDLLYLHRFDDDTALEDTLTTFADFQQRGLIRHIGVSNFAAWQIMKAQSVAQKLGTRIDVVQPMYNLVKRQAEVEIFGVAADQDIKIVPYSPLGGGLLTGKYARGETGRLTDDDRYSARYGQAWMHDAARALANLASQVGTDPATLAVAWVAKHASNPSPIISARSAQQLAPSLAAEAFDMPDDLYAEITALSPKPAPATDRLEEA